MLHVVLNRLFILITILLQAVEPLSALTHAAAYVKHDNYISILLKISYFILVQRYS